MKRRRKKRLPRRTHGRDLRFRRSMRLDQTLQPGQHTLRRRRPHPDRKNRKIMPRPPRMSTAIRIGSGNQVFISPASVRVSAAAGIVRISGAP